MATTRGEQHDFFAKYTAFWNAFGPFHSDPWDVLDWNQVALELFLAGVDPGGPFDAALQESNDLETWTNVVGTTVAPVGTLWSATATVGGRYVRLYLDNFQPTASPALYVLWASGVARSV